MLPYLSPRFIVAVLFLLAYMVFMIVKASMKIKNHNLGVFLHSLFALLSVFSFLFMFIHEFRLMIFSVIGFLFLIPACIILYQGIIQIKTQALKQEGPLIKKGIYAKTRNPLYLGIILIAFGLVFFSFSVSIFIYSIILATSYMFVIKAEEKELSIRYGKQYEKYKKNVPALIPRF